MSFVEQATDHLKPLDQRQLVCLEKIGPILKRALRDMGIGEWYGTSAIYTGADHREAA